MTTCKRRKQNASNSSFGGRLQRRRWKHEQARLAARPHKFSRDGERRRTRGLISPGDRRRRGGQPDDRRRRVSGAAPIQHRSSGRRHGISLQFGEPTLSLKCTLRVPSHVLSFERGFYEPQIAKRTDRNVNFQSSSICESLLEYVGSDEVLSINLHRQTSF